MRTLLRYNDNKRVGHRIIIFCDFEGLLWLGDSDEWDSDGTFDATPGIFTELFAQLYVCHGKVDDRKEVSCAWLHHVPPR